MSCTFVPGATITITLNGFFYQTAIAPASGELTETFNATDPHISLNGGSAVATNYGTTNTFVATGSNANGNTNVATTLVTIPAATENASATSLAFTGSDIMALIIGGLALMAFGFLVVIFSRRRRPAFSA